MVQFWRGRLVWERVDVRPAAPAGRRRSPWTRCRWQGCPDAMDGTDGYCAEHRALLARADAELEDRLDSLA